MTRGMFQILALCLSIFTYGCNKQASLLRRGPEPQIISTSSDSENATLFDYKIRVHSMIKNIGSPGYILVTYRVTQGPKEFSTSQRVYFGEQEEKKGTAGFEEVKLNDKEISYTVEAVAEN